MDTGVSAKRLAALNQTYYRKIAALKTCEIESEIIDLAAYRQHR